MYKVDCIQTVYIGGLAYSINVEESPIRDAEGNLLLGRVDYNNTRIDISSSMQSQDYQKVTLLHEIIHAIDHQYRIGLDEEVTDKLAFGLFNLLEDNEIFNR